MFFLFKKKWIQKQKIDRMSLVIFWKNKGIDHSLFFLSEKLRFEVNDIKGQPSYSELP